MRFMNPMDVEASSACPEHHGILEYGIHIISAYHKQAISDQHKQHVVPGEG